MADTIADTTTADTAAAPPAPPPMPTQAIDALPFVVTVPNLRNGALVDIQQAAPKSAMSALYAWPVITALTFDHAISVVEYSIRASYAQYLHALGAAATAADQAEGRKRAIVLASVRAGAAAAYHITAADVTRSETVPAGMTYDPAARRIGQANTAGTATTRWGAAQSMAPLTTIEMGVVAACVYLGMGVPPLQGVSLVMTGHHYIPPTYSLFQGLKKQMLGSTTTEVKGWIEGMADTFNDIAFHKACHPIAPTLKRALAKDNDVAHRLKASGHGSVAIRLPALPSEASGGKAAIALLKSAQATVVQMGHTLSYSRGATLMAALESAAAGQAEATACDDVVNWIASSAAQLAFCAGIVQQVHETSGQGKNTILAAYSVKRIMADNPADVNRGVMYARAANARLRRAMEEGTFADPALAL
jgi:hypothetical protein